MRAPRAIGHLDADTFYVSAERVRFAHLRRRPVGVLGNQGACVIAKSREMKAAGVATGEPIWQARRKCPEGLYVKRDFVWYEALSRRMLDCVRDLFSKVEYASIDEFVFEAAPLGGLSYQGTAEAIRDRIWRSVGLPVTVGIGRTRTLAKLIADAAKPFGALALLEPGDEASLLAQQPVTEVSGIAGRRAARLAPWGILSCLDFARADPRLIRRLLTVAGEALWYELNGDPVLPIHAERPRHKVLSRGGSLGAATADPMVLYGWLVRNAERLVEELRYHQLCTGLVSAWVGYRDGRAGVGREGLPSPTDRFDLLLDALRPCLRRAWIPRVPATRMHLFAEQLSARGAVQLGLFDPPAEPAGAVARAKEAINGKHGRFVLRSAATLALAEIYADPATYKDIGDIRGKTYF
jgi:nucleotidyltransferase/DNA polymerase involved in DNA repair